MSIMQPVTKTISVGMAALIITLTGNAFAQSSQDTELGGSYQSNEQDATFGGNPLDVMDLFHNSQLGNKRNPLEFNQDTNNNLDNAAEQFRRQQLERLNQQYSPNNSKTETFQPK